MLTHRRWYGLAPLVMLAVACSILRASPGQPTDSAPSFPPGARQLTADEAYYRHPVWSPDATMIASLRSPFVSEAFSGQLEGDVVLIEIETATQRTVTAPEVFRPGLAGGPVFWLDSGSAVAFYYFDSLGGQVMPTIIQYNLATMQAQAIEVCCAPFTANADGSEFLVNMSSEDTFGIGWLNLATGQVRPEMTVPARRESPREHVYSYVSLSPDGRTLLMGDVEDRIFAYTVGSGRPPELFLSEAVTPAWHPEGSKIAYVDLSGGADYYTGLIVIANADGSLPQPLFPESPHRGMLEPAWSPDGSQIAFLYGGRTKNVLLVADVPEDLQP